MRFEGMGRSFGCKLSGVALNGLALNGLALNGPRIARAPGGWCKRGMFAGLFYSSCRFASAVA